MIKHKLILFLLSSALMLLCADVFAQQITVSGVVVSQSDSQPLIGSTVMVKGTTNATSTNKDGRYTITVKKGDILLFNYIGMESTTVTITNQKTVNVSLKESSESIEELVVVGYAMVKKSDLTGSVQSISNEEFMKGQPLSIEQGMQGRLAGVNVVRNDGAPGGGISVQVRGVNSFQGSTEPLYVIDGVPIYTSNDDESMTFDDNEVQSRNALSFLDPNDIESIEVLKDASSTAIYGSRGSNGVVLVTTKSGKSGTAKIEFSAGMTLSQVTNKIRVLTGAEYAEYRNQAYINTQLINSGTYNPQALPYLGGIGQLGSYVKGPQDYDNNNPYYWQDAIFRTAVSQNYHLSYSGRTNQGDYAVGLSYVDQQGTVINSGYDRLSFNIKLNKDIRKWLKIGTSTNFSMANSQMVKTSTSNQNNGDEGVIRSAIYFLPIYDAGDEPGYEEYQLVSNPIDYTKALNENKSYSIYSSNYANVTLAKGLMLRTVFGYKASINFSNRYFPRNLYEGREARGKSLAGDIQTQDYVWDNMLMYNRTFNKKHNLNATLGTSWDLYSYYSKQVGTQGFGFDNNGWILQDGTKLLTPQSAKMDATTFSLIARAAYTFDSKYFLTATFRRDESSRFADNNKFAYFPSVGVAWKISGENFLRDSKVISNLKIRYSYGSSGNAGIRPYQSLRLFEGTNYPFGDSVEPGYGVGGTTPGNENLKWETTYQHDLGLDLQLFNKVNIEADFYSKRTSDLIQSKDLAPSSGYTSVLYNVGGVTNKGVDFSFNWNVMNNKNFSWSVNGNFAVNTNKVTSIGGETSIFPNVLWNDLRPFIIVPGRPIGQLYGFVEDGIWSSREEVIASDQFQKKYPGYTTESNVEATELLIKQKWVGEVKIKDLDGNGSIGDEDQTYIGNVNPDFIYAFGMNFAYKGFDLSFLFNGVVGNDIINMASLRNNNVGQTRNLPKSILNNAWVPGSNGKNPKVYTTNSRDLYFSRRYIEDGSYLKLRNVSLGYTHQKPFNGIGSIRVYVSMNNMLTFTKYSGYDPEVNSFGSKASARGVDAGGYPQSRQISFGINLTL